MNIPEMTQNLTTIVVSAQPSSSKWCCSGAIRNTRLPVSLNDPTAAETYKDQGGMFEAPPPPMDAPLEAHGDGSVSEAGATEVRGDSSVGEAGATEAGVVDLKPKNDILFLDQGGMFEAPPPPMDAPIKKD